MNRPQIAPPPRMKAALCRALLLGGRPFAPKTFLGRRLTPRGPGGYPARAPAKTSVFPPGKKGGVFFPGKNPLRGSWAGPPGAPPAPGGLAWTIPAWAGAEKGGPPVFPPPGFGPGGEVGGPPTKGTFWGFLWGKMGGPGGPIFPQVAWGCPKELPGGPKGGGVGKRARAQKQNSPLGKVGGSPEDGREGERPRGAV